MYITSHKDGFRVHVEKHGRRASKVCASMREATRWGREKEAEFDAIRRGGGRTFGDLADEYLRRVTPTKRSQQWEQNAIARLRAALGERTALVEIDTPQLAAWRDARLRTVQPSTVQREANLLRNMFTVARDEWRWVEHNPFRGLRMPKAPAPRTALWTWPLIRRVLQAPRTGKTAEMQRAFHIALHTGLRLEEVLVSSYDVRRKVAIVPTSKTSTVPVEVPLTKRALKLLPPPPFTVGANEGSALFSRLLRELLIEGLTFHDSRAFALTMLSRRVDVMRLARISRHKNLSILQNTYYRERAEDTRANGARHGVGAGPRPPQPHRRRLLIRT